MTVGLYVPRVKVVVGSRRARLRSARQSAAYPAPSFPADARYASAASIVTLAPRREHTLTSWAIGEDTQIY